VAEDATATILLVGGGGGGGGGIRHTGSSQDLTTGGGGGGGAGEYKKIENVQLRAGVTYVIFVGKAGIAGAIGANATNGGASSFTDNDGMFHSANGGGLGRSGMDDQYTGAVGGIGYPQGASGGVGISTGAGSDEQPAKGGAGGNNGSGHGFGGPGGDGSAKSGGNVVQAKPGSNGTVGFVKVTYEH
jgi:hypothetical protein